MAIQPQYIPVALVLLPGSEGDQAGRSTTQKPDRQGGADPLFDSAPN